ncbi:MAG TPA: hypothetical protein VKF40_18880 [Burkholderiales bacterium]|nr:hypothetical protein [Burkholderiales bacterium]
MQTLIGLAIVVVVLLAALVAWLIYKRRESRRLQHRFGPEYGRAVIDLGSRAKAESALKARERRVERLHIVPLAPSEAARFTHAWKLLQARFVDHPREVVLQADQLVRELMLKRGYPMSDFEHRAADISVDHPGVVGHYRAAQAIATSDEHNTEQLRRAVVHYRALFDDLLETQGAKEGIMARKPVEMRS